MGTVAISFRYRKLSKNRTVSGKRPLRILNVIPFPSEFWRRNVFTHQEGLNVLVVGDDSVVNDDELYKRKIIDVKLENLSQL